MKPQIEVEVELPPLTEPCPRCQMLWETFYERVAKAKRRRSYDPLRLYGTEALTGLLDSLKDCHTCRNTGEAPTEFGRQVLELVRTFLIEPGKEMTK